MLVSNMKGYWDEVAKLKIKEHTMLMSNTLRLTMARFSRRQTRIHLKHLAIFQGISEERHYL